MSDNNNNNTRTLSLADWEALSTEQKFKTTYHGLLALSQENVFIRRENAELRRRVAELESQQQQQQATPAAAAPTTTTITTVATASSSSTAVATTTTAQKRCYNCDEPGHIKRHCPQNRAGRGDPPAPFTMGASHFYGNNIKIYYNDYRDKRGPGP